MIKKQCTDILIARNKIKIRNSSKSKIKGHLNCERPKENPSDKQNIDVVLHDGIVKKKSHQKRLY